MINGRPYLAWLEDLPAIRQRARQLTWEYNHLPPERWGEREERLRALLGRCGEHLTVEPDFHCDYGCNITVGGKAFTPTLTW